jgi:intein/homing endonuclease
MSCINSWPYYRPVSEGGLIIAVSRNDGYSIALQWDRAFPTTRGWLIGYNIYYSTIENDVFTEGVKFVSVGTGSFSDGYLQATIIDLTPGEMYYFAVRAFEYASSYYNLSLLPDFNASLKVYPEAVLTSDITATDLIIPISDIGPFPSYGIIQIGTELIRYVNKDTPNSSLLVGNINNRGYLGTNVRFHEVDGYDGVATQDPILKFWKGFEESNTVIHQEVASFNFPNYAFTEADGYRTVDTDILTTDLEGSDTEKADFCSYDYAGWHRTDPNMLLNGTCIGTYIGGEHYCDKGQIDGYGSQGACNDGYGGVGNAIRGVPFNDLSHQRIEVLLNATGTPCVLLRRQRTGIRCSCFLPTSEYPEHRCPKCFPPGTLINTESGWVKIEDINVGDKVLSSDGYYHNVTKTFENDYDGYLASIKTSVTGKPLLTTTDHPLLVLRGAHNRKAIGCSPKCDNYIQNGDGVFSRNYDVRQLPGGNWHARITHNGSRKALGSFESKIAAENAVIEFRKEFKLGHKLIWENASSIKEKDWLVSKYNNYTIDVEQVSIPQEFRKNTKLGTERLGPNTFMVDEEFLWIVGIYIAEGCAGTRSIVFGLHKDEVEYRERIIRFFKDKGYDPKVYGRNDNGIAIEINSTSLSKWFPKWLGNSSYNKKIPQEFMTLPSNKIWALISGIYDGDGIKCCNEIGQTSYILALQLVELLHKVGEQPLMRYFQNKCLTPKGNIRKPVYFVNWSENTSTRQNRKGRWNFNGEMLTKVYQYNTISYTGKVYNIEVEGDHTYVAQGIVVHNCYGTGFSVGYLQFFNTRRSDGKIMVRFGPASDDLKPRNAGLESELIPDCYTLVYPAVKDRDIIVKYDSDNLREFYYEILDVTRNHLFLNEYGSQKFKAQRIRKTDKAYQIKFIDSTATIPNEVTTSIGFLRGPNSTTLPHTHTVTINEGVLAISQITQTTSISLGHNHEVINGVIQDHDATGTRLGHTHAIVI